jgi:hypothetical protein
VVLARLKWLAFVSVVTKLGFHKLTYVSGLTELLPDLQEKI